MNDPLFQYQAKAEPVLVEAAPAETITLDKWRGQDPLAPRRKFYNHLYPSFFGPVDAEFAEHVNMDKWYQQHPDPVQPTYHYWQDPASFGPSPAHGVPEEILVENWYVQHPGPTLIKHLEHTWQNHFWFPSASPATGGAIAGIDSWGSFTAEQKRFPKRIPPTFGTTVFSAALSQSVVSIAQWQPQAPERPPAGHRPLTTGPVVIDPSLFLVPTMTGWFQPLSLPQPEPTRPAGASITILDPTLFGVPQIVCWQQPASVPVRSAPRQTGESVTILQPLLVRTPTLDGWWVQAPDLVRARPRQEGTNLLVPMGVPFVDGWGFAAQMPAFPGWSPPDTGVEVILPLPTPSLDMWQGSAVMPNYPALPRWQGRSNTIDVLLDLRGTGDPGGLDGYVFLAPIFEGAVGLGEALGGWVGIGHQLEDAWMLRDNQLYIGSDNPVLWQGLSRRGKYINNATVTWVLKDENESTVTSGTCTYVAGTNGDYEGNIEEDIALVDGDTYYLEVTATAASDQIGKRRITYVAQYHGSN